MTIVRLFLVLALLAAAFSPQVVVVVELKGRIDEGAVILVSKAVSAASSMRASCLVIVLDTYGGYLYSMDKIVSSLSSCPVKKVAWIPPGCKAVSAGAIIALSADEIYVGSGAVLGACQPIPETPKVVEYTKARIRSLAEKRGLKPDVVHQLEEMVTKNRAFTSNELLELGLASGQANSLSDLLEKLGLAGAKVVVVKSDLTVEIVSLLFDPGIAIMMLIVGIFLILLEIKVTGLQGWGIIGAGLIALSFYVLGIIGWNIMTLTLVILGLTSVVIELKKPGLQVFGIIGVALLTLAVILEYTRQPYVNFWSVAPPVAAFTAVVSGILLGVIIKASEAIRLKKPSLAERLKGKTGYAKTRITPKEPGVVYVEGEDWTAVSTQTIEKGEKVVVTDVKELTLVVEKAE